MSGSLNAILILSYFPCSDFPGLLVCDGGDFGEMHITKNSFFCRYFKVWPQIRLMLLAYSEGDNQSVRSSAPVVSRCFPGGYNVKLYISRGRLAWWLLAFLHSA